MNIVALLAFGGAFFSGFSNGLYLYTRQSTPGAAKYPIRSITEHPSEDVVFPPTIAENLSPASNDEGGAPGIKNFDAPTLLSAITQGLDIWDKGGDKAADLVDGKGDEVESQKVTGYAPSPNVPFRVQVKARDSIPNPELGKVPNSEVSISDDPSKGTDALTPGQSSDDSSDGVSLASASVATSGDSIPLPEADGAAQDDGSDKGDLDGVDAALIGSNVDVGTQGQDTPLVFAANTDLVDSVEPLLGNGQSDSTLASTDVASSSEKAQLGVQTDAGDLIFPSARLTDPLVADASGSLPNSGSLFASAEGDSLFLDTAQNTLPVPPDTAASSSSIFYPDDSATAPNNRNPGSQDESYLRNPGQGDPIDQSTETDPCNLVHGYDNPFSACTSSISRQVLAPFKPPTVPRPDADLVLDIS